MIQGGLNGFISLGTFSFVVALLWVWLAMPFYIAFLKQKMLGQYIREDGPQSHQAKAGTPTAGGVVVILTILLSILLIGYAAQWTQRAWPVLAIGVVTVILALLGFSDDALKIAKQKNKGVTGYTKLAIQVVVGLLLGLYVVIIQGRTTVSVFGLGNLPLGLFYPLLSAFIVTGASNAVNLTDGLDGLAGGTVLISLLTLALMIAVPELNTLCWMSMGVTVGFLIFNKNPAQIFMGDTGSLALGGMLGAIAILTELESWLVLLGLIFVLETLSVILQVLSFKTTGKRIFKMSPLHHHFELCGYSEQKVVHLFYVIQALGCALAWWGYQATL